MTWKFAFKAFFFLVYQHLWGFPCCDLYVNYWFILYLLASPVQKETSVFFLSISILILMLLPIFYLLVYLYRRYQIFFPHLLHDVVNHVFIYFLYVVQRNEKRCPRSEAHFSNWTKAKALLIGRYSLSYQALVGASFCLKKLKTQSWLLLTSSSCWCNMNIIHCAC